MKKTHANTVEYIDIDQFNPRDLTFRGRSRINPAPSPNEGKMGGCNMSDSVAREVEALWKSAFPGASLLPVIGLPSNAQGVMTLTHQLSLPPMTINGSTSRSPLANNALFSSECVNGRSLNLYEVMLPDFPNSATGRSTVQVYVNALAQEGLDVAGVHYHWNGASMDIKAIHHQNLGLSAQEFSARTIRALQTALAAIGRH